MSSHRKPAKPGEVYREAASVLVLKPASVCAPDGCGTVYQLLLLHKPRARDAWQLPQGGVESGESIEQAALRELREEAGVADAKIFGASERVYQYDFPASFRRLRPDNVKGQRIGYVFAEVSPDARIRVDGREVDAHAWVELPQLPRYIKRRAYADVVRSLYDEALRSIA